MATAEIITDQQPAGKELWLAERRKFIGGSEAFQLLNQAQYGKGCVRALAYDKLGIEPDYPEQMDDALLERGQILEPIVAEMYAEETNRKLRRPSLNGGFPKPVISKEFPWAGVHTDRLILAGFGDVEQTMDAEIKTRGEGPFYRVIRQGPFPGDLLQVQWSNFVNNRIPKNGHPTGALIILGVFGGLPLKHFDMTRNEEIVDIFKREGDKFGETVFVKGQLPDRPIASDDPRCKVCAWRMECRGEELDRAEAEALKSIKKGKDPLIQISNADLSQTLSDIDTLDAEIKALQATKELAEAKAKELMGANRGAFVAGYGKAYQLPSQANYLDSKRLKAEKPEIYDEYFVSKLTGDTFIRRYPAKL